MITFQITRAPMWDIPQARAELFFTFSAQSEKARSKLKKLVQYWKVKPEFSRELNTAKGNEFVTFDVYTDNMVFNSLSLGVSEKPRYVRGTFGTDWGTYSAGSIPGTLQTTKPVREKPSGDVFKFTKDFIWPGIEARQYYEQVSEQLVDEGFYEAMAAALERSTFKWKV